MIKIKNNSNVITLSYGNYLKGVGGTNKVIKDQSNLLIENRIGHIHIYPVMINENLSMKFGLWKMLINGNELPFVFSTKRIIDFVNNLNRINCISMFIVHHCLNSNINDIEKIIANLGVITKFYVHDYYMACVQPNFLRNGIEYCGSEPPSYSKCRGCKYFKETYTHYNLSKTFFTNNKDKLELIFPSENVKLNWFKSFQNIEMKFRIIPHQKISTFKSSNLYKQKNDRIKVAYIGAKSINKGWNEWKDFVQYANKNKLSCQLYHFGQVDEMLSNVINIPVNFNGEMNMPMEYYLNENNIDVSFLWSNWPETYSFTLYEAFAANTFIVTNKLSGNIESQINQNVISGYTYEKFTDFLKDISNIELFKEKFLKSSKSIKYKLETNTEIFNNLLFDSTHLLSEEQVFIMKNSFFEKQMWLILNVITEFLLKLENLLRRLLK